MSVIVRDLTKIFGQQRAVDSISFQASKGTITGFLGPNGAGKSTTMKMAVGYLPPDAGEVLLDGLSVEENPLAVKKRVGYLPEHNPLYLDMYIREFLRFIGRAYGLTGSRLKQRVEEMIGLVGLEREKKKKIGTLSKGYRQRVGLAQALIHDPSVLVLDEPTTGLDPNQILEIRELIKNVSRDKTVILSTHIMQEVEAICDKVVIIDKGSIVADDDLSVLKGNMNEIEGYVVTFESPVDTSVFIDNGFDLESAGENTYLIKSDNEAARAAILKITSDNDLPLVSLNKAQHSLEEIFHRLTQNKAG